MGIYISSIKMPKSCNECISECINIPLECYPDGDTIPDCPLVEITTPHGRLIDANKLETMMYHEAFETDSDMQKWDSGCWIRYKVFENCMNRLLPDTILEAEEF